MENKLESGIVDIGPLYGVYLDDLDEGLHFSQDCIFPLFMEDRWRPSPLQEIVGPRARIKPVHTLMPSPSKRCL